MSTYPTPEAWRTHADHARKMAAEYRADGNHVKADQREDDADFYETRAELEEWHLAHMKQILKEAA